MALAVVEESDPSSNAFNRGLPCSISIWLSSSLLPEDSAQWNYHPRFLPSRKNWKLSRSGKQLSAEVMVIRSRQKVELRKFMDMV